MPKLRSEELQGSKHAQSFADPWGGAKVKIVHPPPAFGSFRICLKSMRLEGKKNK